MHATLHVTLLFLAGCAQLPTPPDTRALAHGAPPDRTAMTDITTRSSDPASQGNLTAADTDREHRLPGDRRPPAHLETATFALG